MHQNTKALSEQAVQLPPTERMELVERILDSLDQPDTTMDTLWASEADDRLAAYRRGEIRAIPLSEVLAKYKTSNAASRITGATVCRTVFKSAPKLLRF
ncbi:MAG: hypothetical protein RIR09_3074 [Pseudomonadota bacterium]|jgi:putative addiction module component (TIGR02574 family)